MRSFFCRLMVVALMVFPGVSGWVQADWPQYRGDSQRSARAADPLPLPLQLVWRHQAPAAPAPAWPTSPRMTFDRAMQPVVAGDRVLFGSSADGSVTALQSDTGSVCWQFFTEGPIRFAPAIWQDRALVASDDGYLYSLRLSDGQLLWRFRGGPTDSRVLGNDTIISRWPVRGGPVIVEDAVYFAAGIWPSEGIFLYALNPTTGDVIWKNSEAGGLYMPQPHPTAEAKSGVSAQGYLAVAGERLLVPTGRAVPSCFERHTGAFQYFHLQKYGHNGESLIMVSQDVFFNGGLAFDAAQGQSVTKLGTGQIASSEGGVVRSFGTTLAEYNWQESEKPDRKGQPEKVRELVAKWTLENMPTANAIATAGSQIVMGCSARVAIVDSGTKQLAWESPLEGTAYGLALSDGRLFVSTDRGALFCFAGQAPTVGAPATTPSTTTPQTLPDPQFEAVAQSILNQTGVRAGYCLDLGCGQGELTAALARNSSLFIVAVDPDQENVRRTRELLIESGLYGTRAIVQQRDLAATGYPQYFADLIVSRHALDADLAQDVVTEATRLQRPYGGAICYGRADQLQTSVRGPLEGAGQWTHQYADPANTVNSGDLLVRGPLGMLWFRDIDFAVPSRHGRAPAPLLNAGKLFHEGMDGVVAINAYNGRELWRFPLPNLLRAFNGDELMGVSGTGSNMCLGGDHLFVRYEDYCLQLDANTGQQVARYATNAQSANAPLPWGYVAWSDGLLLGSTANPDHVVTFRYVNRGGDLTKQLTESRDLFAIDTQSGKRLWTYTAQHSVRHNAIAVTEGKVFLIDRPQSLFDRVKKPETKEHPTGKLVALDLRTGQIAWEVQQDIFGTVLAASAENDVLLMSYQPTAFRLDSELGGKLAAFRTSDGSRLWDVVAQYQSRPTLNGATVYTQGGAWDLLTGQPVPFDFKRSYGCGVLASARNLLVYRSATLGYYDLHGAKTTENYGGIRPGCWINAIPAGGMVLLPDATAGCECSYLNKAWIALGPLTP